MGSFEPSRNFVNLVMKDVREYDNAARRRRERVRAFFHSKPVVIALSGAGALLGIFNALRIALILISPSLCL